ncbi:MULTISPECIES: urease accessory protein UreF [Rhizobium/Agrobacterium group]|uniref:urease accessory protein UreF n=1 Tax=Rhizobium/Agrobacterium group TaxID=227290 RepID=UPI00037F2F5B|nr:MULTISPECIES: urease accessory protein UreF [Rhizobium/Agrobacterium group]AHK02217.1 urease accessory protein UreF [Agrobacterium tumefaciens LBA4213 (Ach5)]AKC08039.1 urease accessory protein [Agrobacterium tumefaciens]AYM16879.1 urease accessory protein [Agrobacterium tumefaciens]AYM68180.1 urease accessory protein [Agrobacterium tumefaciens]NIB59640.1 urease accessory protein UreF [Agrobacterium tumefaciens]
MSEDRGVAALLRLMAWMSPAFPVGGFSYSGGLEKAVEDRRVSDAAGLYGWVEVLLRSGSLWNDAVFLADAWRNGTDAVALSEAADLARALAGSAERYRETVLLGDAFVAAAGAWPNAVLELLPKEVPYPVAIGAVAAGHGVPLRETVAAFLHAGVSQIVSAGIRLGVAGQKDGVAILAASEATIGEMAARAVQSTLDDLGSATVIADTATMRHEMQGTRLFRS